MGVEGLKSSQRVLSLGLTLAVIEEEMAGLCLSRNTLTSEQKKRKRKTRKIDHRHPAPDSGGHSH